MIRGPALWSVLTVLAAFPAFQGCRSFAVSPGADGCGVTADTLLVLCVGQEVRAPSSAMRVALLAVRNDSRCPVDVVCVWQGNAEVEIGVAFGEGPTVPYVLNTGLEPRGVTVGTTRLTLAELLPAPVSTTSIPPDRYVASLRIQRLATAGPMRN